MSSTSVACLPVTTHDSKASPLVSKCRKCGRRPATKGCYEKLCLGCCDSDKCERHQKTKDQARLKEQILAGTTDVQLMAKAIRGKRLQPGRFREPGFKYVGDSVVIWNIREFGTNDKWKDEAIRKSYRRNARRMDAITDLPPKKLRINIRRFHRIVEQRYQESTKGK